MRLFLFSWIVTFTCSVIAQPSISSFSPVSGPIGSVVTIRGNNFSSIPVNNIVFFGAVKATVVSSSTTTIDVMVPIGATYEPLTVTVNNLTAYTQKPFDITFNTCNSISSTSFGPRVEYGDDLLAWAIKINDLDGDGKPDVTVSWPDGHNISLLKNASTIGNIVLSPTTYINNSDNTTDFAVGDLDGDGKPDIASANNIMSTFRSTSSPGNISFGSSTNYAAGNGPWGIRIRDLDEDGKPDIAMINAISNTISIFKNTSTPGLISFFQFPFISTGDTPYSIWIDDLDGDGKPDLVVPNLHSNTVSLYKNTSIPGTPSFAPPVDLLTPDGPSYASCGDLDGDGKDEIIVSTIRSSLMSVYGNSSIVGNLSFHLPIDFPAPGFPDNTFLTDMNGDGKADILLCRVQDGIVSLFENKSQPGSLQLGAPINIAVGPTCPGVSAGDLDGDGKPDIAVSFAGLSYWKVVTYRNLMTEPPVLKVDSNTATCNKNNGGISATASGGSGPFQFNINGSAFQASGTFTGLVADTYVITLKDANGCMVSKTVKINQTGDPILSANSVNAKCMVNDGSIFAMAVGGIGAYTFSIDQLNFQQGSQFNNLAAGVYQVEVRDSAGCTDDSLITIINNCLLVTATAIPDTCDKGIGRITAIGIDGISPFQYSINGVNFQDSGTFNMLTAGAYNISIHDAENAKSSVNISVPSYGSPVTVDAGNDITICQGERRQLNGNSNGTIFSWVPSDFLSDGSVLNPDAFPQSTIAYILTASNSVCLASDTVTVLVNALPDIYAGSDTAGVINGQMQLQAINLNNSSIISYSWSPSAGLTNPRLSNPMAILNDDINYIVSATTAQGCTGTDNISIKVFKKSDIYVPNAFTPNGDGLNDIFKVNPVGIRKFMMLTIYNRWGQIVFATNDAKYGWNGSFKGKFQPVGIYTWLIEGEALNGTLIKKKGILTLLR